MRGIDRETGKTLTGWPLFVSHASDVLTTQVGTRTKRRQYGSRCPELRGKNNGPYNQMLMRAYVAQAFENPDNGLKSRFELSFIGVAPTASGFAVSVRGKYNGVADTFEVPM